MSHLPPDIPEEARRVLADALASEAQPAQAEDLGPDEEVLFPQRTLTVGGERVTIAEYSFAQGMQISAAHQPLLADLAEVFLGTGAPAEVDAMELQALLGRHWQAVLDLIALATGRPAAWVAALSDDDGQALMLTWWGINQGFFARRLALAAVSRGRRSEASGRSSPS